MRVHDFLRAVVQETRLQLPRRWRGFDGRSRFTLIQLFFEKRSVHYEVWIRGGVNLIEVGLHCEADRETNARLLDYFRAREFEIHTQLGPRVECEQWTQSWTRVHQVVPYKSLDGPLVKQVANNLAKMILVLQPMLDQFEDNYNSTAKRKTKKP